MAVVSPRSFAATACVIALAMGAVLPASVAQDSTATTPSASTTYAAEVKPITDRKCSGCHVNGGHAGGLKLDSFESLMKGGEDGPVVALGDPAKSMLATAIHYNDSSLQMPPKEKLSDADILVIDNWIRKSSAPLEASVAEPAPASAPSATAVKPVGAETAALVEVAADAKVTPLLLAAREDFFETNVRPVLVNKCYFCHASAAKGGLRLDSRKALLQGGKDGPVVVIGHPEQSMLTSAIHYSDAKLQMPPRGALKPEQVAAIDKWIAEGLVWPKADESPATTKVTAQQKDFWSFKPAVAQAVPVITGPQAKWADTDIDRFVLAKLAEKKLIVGGDADKRTLLRRVTYDLTGLPPTPDEINAFMADKSPQAYEHVVDRLLASKAYGERWGRMWLDVVRYADTTGGGGDYPVPQLYKYRNYVIDSFNEDKPYDRFIKEQIAGDLLPAANEEEHWKSVIATGYLAGASTNDRAQVQDAVDNLGYAFLGTTVACARCHDHKFDPIPTSDYYAIAGILKSTHFPNAGNDGIRWQTEFYVRDPKQLDRQDIKDFQAQLKPITAAITGVLQLPGTYDDLMPQLERRRMDLYARAPQFPEDAYAVSDAPKPLEAQIQVHGDPTNLGDEVPRGTLQVLGGGPLPADAKGSGRLQLAEWIASANNPLTARVIVNRLWQGHFGRGIVPTPNNFGTRGVPPSDQALLDYLATDLVAKKWSIKAMQREMVLSHVYRLSTAKIAADDEIDPDNLYQWRHNRLRLDAEEIRDSLLADSQLLDRTMPGAQPFPPMSEWNWEEQNPFVPDAAKYDNDKRTVYMMVQRSVKNRYMTLFDGPDAIASTDQRTSSLTPLQALYFMNSPFPKRCSDHLAQTLDDGKTSESVQLDRAFMDIYGRLPAKIERERSLQFIEQVKAKNIANGDTPEAAQRKAESHLYQAMFSSNEFMFVE